MIKTAEQLSNIHLRFIMNIEDVKTNRTQLSSAATSKNNEPFLKREKRKKCCKSRCCSAWLKRSFWREQDPASDFIFTILFLGGRERIGCLTLIHNVPRCVKLFLCQKVTALHSVTHALVISGGLC